MKRIILIVLIQICLVIFSSATNGIGNTIYTVQYNYNTASLESTCGEGTIYLVVQLLFIISLISRTLYLSWRVLNAPLAFNESRHLVNAAVIEVFCVIVGKLFITSVLGF